jgi:hypothetical protein
MKASSMIRRLAITLVFVGGSSCGDPVHSDAVGALGGEVTAPGPTHRPGQPCLVCHGGLGPASAEFSFAGTIYKAQDAKDILEGVTVQITDAKSGKGSAKSNNAGNFYIPVESFTPVFPARVQISFPDGANPSMVSHIGHDGSCASCHSDPASPGSPGHVYLVDDPMSFPGMPQ